MVMKHTILKQLGAQREEVLAGPEIGQDFALIQGKEWISGASAVQVCYKKEDTRLK